MKDRLGKNLLDLKGVTDCLVTIPTKKKNGAAGKPKLVRGKIQALHTQTNAVTVTTDEGQVTIDAKSVQLI